MSTPETPEIDWITGRESGRRLRVSARAMPRFAERWGIRRRILQGSWTTYFAADVDAVASRAVIVGDGVADGVACTS
jgi:hypothetical protein